MRFLSSTFFKSASIYNSYKFITVENHLQIPVKAKTKNASVKSKISGNFYKGKGRGKDGRKIKEV